MAVTAAGAGQWQPAEWSKWSWAGRAAVAVSVKPRLEVFATAIPRPTGLENAPSSAYAYYNHAPDHMTKEI